MGLIILGLLVALALPVVLVVYILKTNALSEKVEELESEIDNLRRSIRSLMPAQSPPPAQVAKAPQVETATSPPVAPAATPPLPPPIIPRSEPQPPLFKPRAPEPSRTREEWEALIGGKLLNRIGAFALILGVGFFLKYAFDNDLISEPIRVLIGFAVGAGLLLGGGRFHKKGLAIFAQGLIGAGIAILYLSVYASFNYYHLVSQPVAFVLMSAVTALTFFQGLKYDSLAVALLGWAGGFLTPIMLSTGQANEAGLFTYIALLDLGLLAIMLRKDAWVILEPLTLIATYLIYILWYDKYYVESDWLITVFFLTIFWGLFHGLEILRTSNATTSFEKVRQAVAGFNALFYYGALYNIIDSLFHPWMSTVTLLIGAIYFGTFLLIKQRQPNAILAQTRHALTAVILLVVATEIQFDNFQTVVFWSLEALFLCWSGLRWKMNPVWQAALGLLGLAFLKLISTEGAFSYSVPEQFSLILNQRALAFAVLAAATGLSAILFKQAETANSEIIQAVLHSGWSALLFMLFTAEINDYFRRQMLNASEALTDGLSFNRAMTWAAAWTLYSLPLVWLGLRRKILPTLYGGLITLGLAMLTLMVRGLFFSAIDQFTILLNARAGVFLLVILGAIVQTRWLNQESEAQIRTILQAAWSILLLILCTIEINDYFRFRLRDAADQRMAALTFNRFMAWATVWTIYSLPMVWLGLKRKILPLLYSGFGGLSLAIIMIAIQGITFSPIAQFTPALNWRAAVFVCVIAGTIVHVRWLRADQQNDSRFQDVLRILQVAVVLLLLDLLTGETRDIFKKAIFFLQQTTGAPEKISRLQDLQQLALSGVWLFYSVLLMVAGLWRRVQGLRIIAIALFGITILKIFIYDLSFLERLYRIFSFIGLGVILLLVSYLYQRYKAVIFEGK